MRRLQAILVIFSILVVPLSLMINIDSCYENPCPCCAATSHAHAMNCRSDLTGQCAMSGRGQTQQSPYFLLAAHQARLAALPFAKLARPFAHRVEFSDLSPSLSCGFASPPFEPPRS
jgi:hypothetical protein